LQTGQVWRFDQSNLEIGLVGRVLVHYKSSKAQHKRSPAIISGKDVLEKFLRENNAILIKQPRLSLPTGRHD
jgi:hypothetical protein